LQLAHARAFASWLSHRALYLPRLLVQVWLPASSVQLQTAHVLQCRMSLSRPGLEHFLQKVGMLLVRSKNPWRVRDDSVVLGCAAARPASLA
jgi:hypothetical protein